MKKLFRLFQSESEEDERILEAKETVTHEDPSCALVLLGTGGAGKSSIFQRCTQALKDANPFRVKLEVMMELVNIISYTTFTFQNREIYLKLLEIIQGRLLEVEQYWDKEFNTMMFEIFQDSKFQNHLQISNRGLQPFLESVTYFTKEENFKRIFLHDCDLTWDDLFYSRSKTTGMIQKCYLKNTKMVIFDTGGQRTERKKWDSIPRDSNCKMIIGYVVSLSEFDQLCYEDDKTCRYYEGLTAFENWNKTELANRGYPVYLIFSKLDVLEEKVNKGFLFSEFVPEFKGNNSNVEEIVEFIVEKYFELDVDGKVMKHFVISSLKTEQAHKMVDNIFEMNNI